MTMFGGEPPIDSGESYVEWGEPYIDWDEFAPYIAHPIREAIVEAIRRIDEPLSPADLKAIVDDPTAHLASVSYHFRALAEAGLLVEFGGRPTGHSVEILYLVKSLA